MDCCNQRSYETPEGKITSLIRRDRPRVEALNLVAQLDLPQCYIAAGFIRNLVWDALHKFKHSTPLHDVDVIYFDPAESDPTAYQKYEAQLTKCMPRLNWQVRNQAKMHQYNGDPAYHSTLDAMHHWPEKETAVAARQISPNTYELIAAFGFDSLFSLCITHNPKRSRAIFDNRVHSKQWLTKWPALKLAKSHEHDCISL
ncbi:nucleotidyltransferase family protein [Pseudoalteromonas sp. PPB1]|uniref:nucleotidyltransferase family protein n=1 Tax=Pseudoalteromonas sp. PPB1 TaxID=2756136 RepID=UPI0018913794|nr:nucleotidyltransferase family protein [Pseudoalteromonas sp. PPB1]